MQQVPLLNQKPCLIHRDMGRYLFHPLLARMTRDTCQADSSALQVNEKQHIVRFQSGEREHFHGEEVRSHHDRHMSTDEVCPAGILLPLPGWRNIMPLKNVSDCLI